MDAITLQFVGATDIASKAIEWFSQGVVSHVDAVLENGDLLGARSDLVGGKPAGVQIRPANYERFARIMRVVMPCSEDMAAKFYALIQAEIGKPYDKEAIAAFVVGRDWREPSAWFCSELQGAKAEECGYFASPLATPANKLTPSGLLLACSARVPVLFPSG